MCDRVAVLRRGALVALSRPRALGRLRLHSIGCGVADLVRTFGVALLVGLGCVLWLITLLPPRVAGRRFRRDRLLSGY